MEVNLSNGWLYRFKKRNSFKRYLLFGESADVNIEGIIFELPKLRKKHQNIQSMMFSMPTSFDCSTNQIQILASGHQD